MSSLGCKGREGVARGNSVEQSERERERERFGNGTRKTETQNTYKEVVYVHREINDKRGESREHSPVGLDTVRLTFAIQNGNVISSQASLGLDGHQEW